MSVKIITTSDGSHSLFNDELNETYHSIHGAIQESNHVFLKNGLEYVAEKTVLPLSLLEVGFGTGLNALLTFQYAIQHDRKIYYRAIEPSPLEENIWMALNYPALLNLKDEFTTLHSSPWNNDQILNDNFILIKMQTTLQEVKIIPASLDLVYFDAFAPSRQPDIWEVSLLKKIFSSLKPGGVMVTYCAKGELKRNLSSLGFTLEIVPGPPGKREMIRATKT